MKEISYNLLRSYLSGFMFILWGLNTHAQERSTIGKIDLAGKWNFQIDSFDKGIIEQWFNNYLTDSILLPGSMTGNCKGNNITVNTQWTGIINDSSCFTKPQYANYRVKGNIKIPFWLQPVKHYKGVAWYQKEISIPGSWKGKWLVSKIDLLSDQENMTEVKQLIYSLKKYMSSNQFKPVVYVPLKSIKDLFNSH